MIPYHWQYLPLLLQILVAFGLGLAMVTASWFIGRHRNTAVKLAAYECGIEAVGDARGRFSVRFYMVAMLFILFDVEAVFMMPWAVIYRKLPPSPASGSSASGRWWSTSASSPSASTTSCARASSTGATTRRTSRHGRTCKSTLTGQSRGSRRTARPSRPSRLVLAWNSEALTDAKFDRGELTLTVARDTIRAAAQPCRPPATTSSRT